MDELRRVRMPRWIHKIYARMRGYFWMPCPICGCMFGGHETAQTTLMIDLANGWCVCKKCDAEAAIRNKELHGWTA